MAGSAGRRNILREISALDIEDRVVNSSSANHSRPSTEVIQYYGSKRKSATYTFGASDPVFFKTPTKSPKKSLLHERFLSPTKTPVRSSPRKRLNSTPDKSLLNESECPELSHQSKHIKLGPLQNVKCDSPLEKSLKALSHEQLVAIINEATKSSPEIQQVFDKLMPEPDLSPAEKKLYELRRNVYKSFPRNIWGTQDSSFCYLRVRTHLEAYKKECLNMCKHFMDSNHWRAVFEYIFIAWKYTSGLPDWNNALHNKTKTFCMKQLAAQFIDALNKGNLDKDALSELVNRLKEFGNEPAIETCLKHTNDLMSNASL